MELDENRIPKIAFLCSLHFKEKDLDKTSLVFIRVRPNAVPFVCCTNIKFEPVSSIVHFVKRVYFCREMTLFYNIWII